MLSSTWFHQASAFVLVAFMTFISVTAHQTQPDSPIILGENLNHEAKTPMDPSLENAGTGAIEKAKWAKDKALVERLLKDMIAGDFRRGQLPHLNQSHIPHLIAYSKNQTPLKSFPVHIFSSYAQRECSAGMLALWMVEGIRRGEGESFKFPSLNPICFKKGGSKVEHWEKHSLENQMKTAQAYEQWWTQFKQSGREQDFQKDPLKNTNLFWY